jgi:hypothetical protein
MGVPTAGDFNKWDGNKFTNTDWDQNVDKTVEILANGNYDLNVNQITASNYVGLPTDMNVENGYLYVSGAGNFETEQSATPGQSVLVDTTGGSTIKGNDGSTHVSTAVSKTTVALPASDASNPRWDLVEFDASAGTFNVNQGTASANPTYPTLAANKDAIAFVYRKASTAGNTVYNRDILDARVSIKNKTVDGHFKTNFSIDQKEDTEPSEMYTQQAFQQIPFNTKFDYVQPEKTRLQVVETVVVPASPVNGEIVYTGTWNEAESADYSYGVIRASSTSSEGTATLSFTGVSCSVSLYETSDPQATFYAELSSDGGSTWSNRKTIASNSIGNGVAGSIYSLYQGLEYGDYKVRITNKVVGSTYISIESFQYGTYLVQAPITQKAHKMESASSLADVPPMTTLLDTAGGSSSIVALSNGVWNGSFTQFNNNNQTIELKFYGDKIFVNVFVNSGYNATISVEIDGVTTNVKSASITLPSYNADRSLWVRLDDGNLSEGKHTCKITTTSTAAGVFTFMGWATYSSKAPTTCARSLICGKDSYAVGVDDSAFTFTGTWTRVDDTHSFCGRLITTNTQSDYLSITTPTNVKAIYLITYLGSARGEIKISLGGASSNVRYVNPVTSNVTQASSIQPLYDAYMDGISLDSQELRITNNSTNYSPVEGIIFECGEPVEADYINCMPKWTRYNYSIYYRPPVTTSQRIDVYGSKSDGSEGTKPMVHSGFCYASSTLPIYYRHGLNVTMEDYTADVWDTGANTYAYPYALTDQESYINQEGDAGLMKLEGITGINQFKKAVMHIRRVI